jgi:prophage DNA circulation protein
MEIKMAALQQLLPASFRGVPFLVPSGTAEGGRHSIKHEYPDASNRYVEDNGRCVPDFKVKCVVHGANAIGNLRALQDALDTPGPGTLIHPIYGRQFVQVFGPYSLKHDDNTVGVYEIECTFAVTGPPSFPGRAFGIAAAITNISAAAITNMFSAFSSGFDLPLGAASVAAISSQLASITGAIGTAFNSVNAVVASVRSFEVASSYQLSVPVALASNLQTMVRAPFEATDRVTPSQIYSGFLPVFERSQATIAAAQAIAPTTLDLVQRKVAMNVLGGTMSGVAFCSLAEAAAAQTYKTSEQVSSVVSQLTSFHNAIKDNYSFDQQNDLSLQALLYEISAVLAAQQVVLPNVVPFEVHDIPASVMTYLLYDDLERLDTVIGLNSGKDMLDYDGRVLTLHA